MGLKKYIITGNVIEVYEYKYYTAGSGRLSRPFKH